MCAICQEDDFEEFRHRCVHESSEKTATWFETYGLRTFPSWEYSMLASTLTFFDENSAPILVFGIQVVGTTETATWEWSWGNGNLPSKCSARIFDVRDFGDRRGWKQLTTLFLGSDKYVGWECASIANHLLDGMAAYRCPTGPPGEEEAVYIVILSLDLDMRVH
jgi:hypothetical protein